MRDVDPGFIKATSSLLPEVDMEMVTNYLTSDINHCSAENTGAKCMRSGRENYGDKAIGFVQVKKDRNICILRACITPEHRVRLSPYNVELVIDETKGEVRSLKCCGCAASLGGCKHGVALLMWAHRRSEEPPVTSVSAYWKRSTLARALDPGSAITSKEIAAKARGDRKAPVSRVTLPKSFLMQVVNDGLKLGARSQLLCHFKLPTDVEKMIIHNLVYDFMEQGGGNVKQFLQYCATKMTDLACSEAEKLTRSQSECSVWAKLRFGRATASKFHELAKCKTVDGSLVEAVLGAKFKETGAIKRGKLLEPKVIKIVGKILGKKIYPAGLTLRPDLPVIGASPDGRGDGFLIEIKCPSKAKTIATYRDKYSKITQKYKAQVQMQMHMTKVYKTYYCIASPDFEKTEKVYIEEIEYDEQYALNLIKSVMQFWEKAVFPMLLINRNY